MITIEQAKTLTYRDIVHYCPGFLQSQLGCRLDAKGKSHSVLCRVSGVLKLWKTRPNDFRLPVKHGLYDSGAITQDNAANWYLPGQCPICDGREYHIIDHYTGNVHTVIKRCGSNALAEVFNKLYPLQTGRYKDFRVDGVDYYTLTSNESGRMVYFRTTSDPTPLTATLVNAHDGDVYLVYLDSNNRVVFSSDRPITYSHAVHWTAQELERVYGLSDNNSQYIGLGLFTPFTS